MDAERQYTRDKHLTLLQKSMATLEHILLGVTREHATTLRDGDNGWTSWKSSVTCAITNRFSQTVSPPFAIRTSRSSSLTM